MLINKQKNDDDVLGGLGLASSVNVNRGKHTIRLTARLAEPIISLGFWYLPASKEHVNCLTYQRFRWDWPREDVLFHKHLKPTNCLSGLKVIMRPNIIIQFHYIQHSEHINCLADLSLKMIWTLYDIVLFVFIQIYVYKHLWHTNCLTDLRLNSSTQFPSLSPRRSLGNYFFSPFLLLLPTNIRSTKWPFIQVLI